MVKGVRSDVLFLATEMEHQQAAQSRTSICRFRVRMGHFCFSPVSCCIHTFVSWISPEAWWSWRLHTSSFARRPCRMTSAQTWELEGTGICQPFLLLEELTLAPIHMLTSCSCRWGEASIPLVHGLMPLIYSNWQCPIWTYAENGISHSPPYMVLIMKRKGLQLEYVCSSIGWRRVHLC